MLDTKDLRAFLSPLAAVATSLSAVPMTDEHRGRTPAEIIAAAHTLDLPAHIHESVTDAAAGIARRNAPPYRVLICGSLYLAGEVLREHG